MTLPRAKLNLSANPPLTRANLNFSALPRERAKIDLRMTFRWEGVFEKWSRQWVKRNYWRVKHVLPSEEDALQECALVFARCLNHYAHVVDNPAWLMALYKQSVARAWHLFSTKDSAERVAMAYAADIMGDEAEAPEAPLRAALATASEELRTVLALILDAPSELLEMIFVDNVKASINGRLRRMCGISKKVDLMAELDNIVS